MLIFTTTTSQAGSRPAALGGLYNKVPKSLVKHVASISPLEVGVLGTQALTAGGQMGSGSRFPSAWRFFNKNSVF